MILYFKLVIVQFTKQHKNFSLSSPIRCVISAKYFSSIYFKSHKTSQLLILKVNFHLYLLLWFPSLVFYISSCISELPSQIISLLLEELVFVSGQLIANSLFLFVWTFLFFPHLFWKDIHICWAKNTRLAIFFPAYWRYNFIIFWLHPFFTNKWAVGLTVAPLKRTRLLFLTASKLSLCRLTEVQHDVPRHGSLHLSR